MARSRKDQLAAVAADLFRARGYAAVGVDDIAAAAGLTGPALYRHFPDKQTVLFEVLRGALEGLWETTTEAVSRAGDDVEPLLAAVAACCVDQRGLAVLWRREGRHLSKEQQRELRARSNAVLTAWAKVLLAARPGLAPADAEVLCLGALSVFGSVMAHHMTVARARFVALLASTADRVVHAALPARVEAAPASLAEAASSAPRDVAVASARLGVGTATRREQLLAAATDLFHRHGFQAVSMDDIGAAAGIAGPSVYRHFPSKTALLFAIARRAADRLAAGAEVALRTSTSEREALHRLVWSYVDTITGSAELTVAFSGDTANLSEHDLTEFVRAQRDYVSRWADLLAAARPELGVREARITVRAALAIANDLSATHRLAVRPDLPADLAALMAAALGL
jgi:AcrR family transcriptional regulator